jgi:Ran GTPase-activating protein (RanGAP) involved in mRNA processing and transport
MHHREPISTATTTKQNATGIYYPARPSREAVLQRLSEALLRRSLHKIDLSQRSLQASDAKLVKMALAQNANLTVLKLGYNNLGDAGVTTLAAGIVAHRSLNLLDLGFNNIGDEGIRALAHSLQEASEEQRRALCNSGSNSNHNNGNDLHGNSPLHTLYLAGNHIGEDGAIAIADFLRRGSRLRKLFLAGNRIGGEGVKAITEAILEQQETMNGGLWEDNSESPAIEVIDGSVHRENGADAKNTFKKKFHGIQELYLGGTGMELTGCQAISRLLEKSSSLRVLSLPNCDIGDEEVQMLALSIKSNKDRLPLESLQLSFNNITHNGLESIANALWGSTTLRELKVDNNMIGDRGAHQMAAIIPAMKGIEVLDVGFNSITAPGLTVLMKTVAESKNLLSLSLSGNAIDANAAKSVAYALAYNCSLKSIFLVHCSIGHEEQRHITAGIVSNSRTAMVRLNGFEIGRKYCIVWNGILFLGMIASVRSLCLFRMIGVFSYNRNHVIFLFSQPFF